MMRSTTDTRLTVHPLEAQKLTIQKGHFIILDNISLTLPQGTFAALVGPSGCGKTSLLRVLALLDAPLSGHVCFGGEEPVKRNSNLWLDSAHLYPHVTYVPQTLALWPHMTLRENMLFATGESAQVLRKCEDLCEHLGISTIVDRRPSYVSQGQRQRCALVRALLLGPRILLLDEITAALDEELARNVWSLLRSFTQDGGSILASTHSGRLASACDYCYKICNRSLRREAVEEAATLW